MNGRFGGMSVRTKLAMAFGTVCLILLGIGVSAYVGLDQTMTHSELVANSALPGIDRLREFQAMQESMYTYSQGLLLTEDPALTAEYFAAWKSNNIDATKALDEYASKYLAPSNAELMPKLKKAWSDLQAADGHTVDLQSKYLATGDATWHDKAIANADASNDQSLASIDVLFKMTDTENARAADEMARAQAANRRATLLTGGGVAGGVVLAIALALLNILSITRPLERVITGLSVSAEQVFSASAQVASASQQLAHGSSEQAANIEETSSALEEMAGMTRENASNSRKADEVARDAQASATRGVESVRELNDAIARIKETSDSTARIIKTIDEIAFQTNLLALNAAVEAARAGEAGRGFAVVAEEVRNLAQRSAEAAKSTSALLEESQTSAVRGVSVSEGVTAGLVKIAEGVDHVTELVGRIATASEEQAEGIDQVNTAVADMDRVTQANAANAEESASASEELSAQAAELHGMVSALIRTVRGGRDAAAKAPVAPPQDAVGRTPARPHVAVAAHAPVRLSPEQVIPLDDDDLADF